MPQAKTTKKKATGKTSSVKVGGGGVGTRVSKLNLKIVIPIVVLVAALGGFYIFRKSSAGAARTFERMPEQMSGGVNKTKQNGIKYKQTGRIDGGGRASTWVTWSEINKSSRICADVLSYSGKDNHGYGIVPDVALSLAEYGTWYGKGSNVTTKSGGKITKTCISSSSLDEFKKHNKGKSGVVHISVHCYESCTFADIEANFYNIYGE